MTKKKKLIYLLVLNEIFIIHKKYILQNGLVK